MFLRHTTSGTSGQLFSAFSQTLTSVHLDPGPYQGGSSITCWHLTVPAQIKRLKRTIFQRRIICPQPLDTVEPWPAPLTMFLWSLCESLWVECASLKGVCNFKADLCLGAQHFRSVAGQKWKCGSVVSVETRLSSSHSLSFGRFTLHVTLQSYVTDRSINKEVKATISMATLENYPHHNSTITTVQSQQYNSTFDNK